MPRTLLAITKHALPMLLFCLLLCGAAHAQTTTFTYQGRLTDAGALANGSYDFQFSLFDGAGTQQGATLERPGVTLTDGSFVVQLDFGDVFDGTDRVLEIGVRPGGSADAYTILDPRWPITSTPYAIRSLKAAASDTATTATTADTATTATDATQLGGVAADQYVKTDDPRLTAGNLSGSGTANAIPLWSAGTTLGNSVITQSAAGVQLPNGVQLGVGAQGNRVQFGSPNGETGMSISGATAGATGRADLRYNGSTLTLATGLVAAGPPDPRNGIVINAAGNVGIGTLDPLAGIKLDVAGAIRVTPNSGSIQFGAPNAETGMSISRGNRADLRFDGSTLKLIVSPNSGIPAPTSGIVINTAGNVGIGAVNPAVKLHVAGTGFVESSVQSTNERAILSLNSTIGGQNRVWTMENGIFGTAGLFGIYDRTVGRARLTIDTAGVTGVNVLRITGGADFSENFDVNAPAATVGTATAAKVQAGMVVSIDPVNPGKLSLATRAYDRRVAGIISGAGGVQPGMMMSHEGTLADGKHPVALSGRVYAYVDATRGAVKPGDLLTTSPTPGHAMKVTNHAKARGAIIGKAMTGLKRGKGLVLVLVSLQ